MCLGRNFRDAGMRGLSGMGKEELRKVEPGPVGPGKTLGFQFESDGEPWRAQNRRGDDHFLQGAL